MRKIICGIVALILCLSAFSQADEMLNEGLKSYPVILITQNGKLINKFKEGGRITVNIDGKRVTGNWYFKAEPDLVSLINKRGERIGEVNLNNQKTIKLETDEPVQRGGGVSIGIGVGPVGIATGGGTSGPRFISYNMSKNTVIFDRQKETREDKIRRAYAEKKMLEQQRKALEKQQRKSKRKK